MAALTFDKCCCCIELKTGCFIIGYLSLIGYGIMTVMAGLMLGGGIYALNTEDGSGNKHDVGVLLTVFGAVLLIAVAVALTFAIVLLVGLHKNKAGHVKAYLIYGTIFLVISIMKTIGGFFTASSASSQADEGTSRASGIASDIFSLLLSAYFLLVIRSQYLVMKNEDRRGPAIYSAA